MARRFRDSFSVYDQSAPHKYIRDVYDTVKCSFIVQRSVTCLDLNIGEFTNFRLKKKRNRSELPPEVNKVIITEESCKKYWARNRKLLYDYHLDVAKELEPSLRNVGDQDLRKCYSTKVLLHKISTTDFYKTFLLKLIREEIEVSKEKINFINRLSKIAKRFNFIANDGHIEKTGLLYLYYQRADSITVHNFLTAMNVRIDGYLYLIPVEVFDYVLNHANQTGLNVWSNTSSQDPINATICLRQFAWTECLFRHWDAPRFCDDMRNYRVSWRYELAEDALNDLIEKNLMTRARYFLILQIVSVFLYQKGLQYLQMVWRSIPDPFITKQEFLITMPGMTETEFEDLTDSFVPKVTGEEVMEGLQTRKLQHYCRTTIRRVLSNSRQLATGIDQLKLPTQLNSHLRLEN